jgi:hypothetical protein
MTFLSKFFRTLLANFTSRKFIMTAIVVWYERADHWATVACISSFEKPDQLVAFTAQVAQHRWFLAAALLGYLGIQTAANYSSNASNALQNLVSSASVFTKSEHKETREDVQRVIHEAEEKYLNDPSYAPIKKDDGEVFR